MTEVHPSTRAGIRRAILLRRAIVWAVLGFALLGCQERKENAAGARADKTDFNRDIRPILNRSCVSCHGGVKAAGNVSFVFREEALRAGKSGNVTIVPGHPDASEMIARITSADSRVRMPPDDHGAALAPEEIALIRQWINEGANWAEHWAFVPPKSPPVPAAASARPAASPIDRFVEARLKTENLAPASEADRDALLRRVSFDLVGLPPTISELDAFLADTAPGAFERQVDRLLASPHFGERWASLWMDLARYADTKGYESDLERSVWQYRDWLIDAHNRNLPYDQLVVRQLAGDLLPEPTLDDRIATVFSRLTQTNDEGGTDDEEFRIAATQDRIATTWSVLNGVTFHCVQCHSHPYDPIRHEEYFQFLAFFNNTADTDRPDDFPTLRVPDDRSRHEEMAGLHRLLGDTRRRILDTGLTATAETTWSPAPIHAAVAQPAGGFRLRDGDAFLEGTYPADTAFVLSAMPGARRLTAIRMEIPPVNPQTARHLAERGFVVTRLEFSLKTAGGRELPLPVTRFFADSVSRAPTPLKSAGGATPTSAAPGFHLAATATQHHTRFVVAAFAEPLDCHEGDELIVRVAHGATIHEKIAVARRVRLSVSDDPRWPRLAIDSALTHADRVEADTLKRIAAIPGSEVPTMVELPAEESRETRVFIRGNWLEHGPESQLPNVPKLFPPLPPNGNRDRLALARWFVQPGHPLTSRMAVNRLWEQLFGVGLVETLEDFGSVGEAPSHPELLDWLATRFERDLGWNVKAMLREIALSDAYRRRAEITPESLQRDPRNLLLARGPRNRLSAEMVRDEALAIGGLLSSQLHGPPVMPPQPDGVWESARSNRRWEESVGRDRHRRAIYTFWKRTSGYPSFLAFDAPARDVCSARRIPTNTPLQALVTLNDPVYHEAAQAFARRMVTEGGSTLASRIAWGARLATSRRPSPDQLEALLALHADSLEQARREEAPDPSEIAMTAVATALLNLDLTLTK